jgi:4-carboxymuconolactone decarboxylase
MVHLIGLYLGVSAMLNAFAVPAPEIPPAPGEHEDGGAGR